MSKLISVSEATKLIGVSRQTLENWGSRGIIRIIDMGGHGLGHWVDQDTIKALADTMQDVEHAQQMLTKEKAELKVENKRLHEQIENTRREIIDRGRLARLSRAKDFYLSIPTMMESLELLTAKEADVVRGIIIGETFEQIGNRIGYTHDYIKRIYIKALRCSSNLKVLLERINDLNRIKAELQEAKKTIELLDKQLNNQRKAENALLQKDEAERIKIYKESDEQVKLLNKRLVDVDIPVRALNCLKGAGINTIGDLARCHEIGLMKLSKFGKKTLGELSELLNSFGFHFGMDIETIYRARIAALTTIKL